MAIQGKVWFTNAFLEKFDIWYVDLITSNPLTAGATFKQIPSGQNYVSNSRVSSRQHFYVAIHPKTDEVLNDFLMTDKSSFTVAMGLTTNGNQPTSDRDFPEYMVKDHVIKNGYSIDTETHTISYKNSINFYNPGWNVKVNDGYGGHTEYSNTYVAEFFNLPSNNYNNLYSLYLDIRSVNVATNYCKLLYNHNNSEIVNGSYYTLWSQSLGALDLIPNNGYEFSTAPSYTLFEPSGGFFSVYAIDYNEDGTLWRFNTPTILSCSEASEYVISLAFSPSGEPTPITETYKFIQVYNPSNDNMSELAKVRFIGVTSTGSYTVDLGQYIIDVFKLYINIPTDVIEHIYLLNYDTNIECPIIPDFKVITYCGEVTIENPYNDSLAYDTGLFLYLPFYQTVKLDNNKYVNKTVRLKYVTDILTGDTTIYTYTMLTVIDEETEQEIKTEQIIDTWNCNLAYKIPYRVGNPNTSFYQEFEANSKSFMDKTPVITQYVPNNRTIFIYNYDEEIIIGNIINNNELKNEFLTFTNIIINNDSINWTKEEEEEFINLLQSGIILE